MHREAFALICPQGGEHTPAAMLILKPSTTPPQYTLIKHQPRGDPSPASHFLPSGYSATPPLSSARWLLSPCACLFPLPPPAPSPLPPFASHASGAPGEPLILCLSPQDPGQSKRGPQLWLGTHTLPGSTLPLPTGTGQEMV